MKLLDIHPKYVNEELAKKICQNNQLKTAYIRKYNLLGGMEPTPDRKIVIDNLIQGLSSEDLGFILKLTHTGFTDDNKPRFKDLKELIQSFNPKESRYFYTESKERYNELNTDIDITIRDMLDNNTKISIKLFMTIEDLKVKLRKVLYYNDPLMSISLFIYDETKLVEADPLLNTELIIDLSSKNLYLMLASYQSILKRFVEVTTKSEEEPWTHQIDFDHLTGRGNISLISLNRASIPGISRIDLKNNNLIGNINYIQFLEFQNLTYLNLSENSLTGIIPTTMAQLVNLSELYLNNNTLEGDIFSILFNLLKLTKINISNNIGVSLSSDNCTTVHHSLTEFTADNTKISPDMIVSIKQSIYDLEDHNYRTKHS